MKILITGGAGYIGSTIASALLDAGHMPVILDSLVTGRIEYTKGRIFYKGDIADAALVRKIFTEHPDIQATVHCAALIVVPASVSHPYEYYRENVGKTLELFQSLNEVGCKQVVFSSSAAIYDVVPDFMVTEESPLNPCNPYARTKYMMELVLRDFCCAYGMRGIALRYFNLIGADPQMRTGLQNAQPTHILGKLVQVALGELPAFEITGIDYPTRDGTGIRDYIHVWDLAQAHVKAVTEFDDAFQRAGNPPEGYLVINLGTGKGVTVREMLIAFEEVYGRKVPSREAGRRPGDIAGAYANADKAAACLHWKTELSIQQGIADALKWGNVRKSVLGF
jgi:UDP-glucose 4-epimerase